MIDPFISAFEAVIFCLTIKLSADEAVRAFPALIAEEAVKADTALDAVNANNAKLDVVVNDEDIAELAVNAVEAKDALVAFVAVVAFPNKLPVIDVACISVIIAPEAVIAEADTEATL